MRRVHKGSPPRAAVELHAQGARWGEETGAQKAELRRAALEEQRHLCAYCNQRLDEAGAHIEHWVPRSDPGSRHFRWADLLAVCDGGEAAGGRERWCDRSRGDQPLTLHPARPTPNPEATVRYLADGRVCAADAALHGELERTLNLNAALLVRARRQALDGLLARVQRARACERAGDAVRALEALARRYDDAEPALPPFPCGARPLLERALRQARGRAGALRR